MIAGIYDDAIFVQSAQAMLSYNGNTDPTRYRIGHGTTLEKGMASLDPVHGLCTSLIYIVARILRYVNELAM